MALSAEETELIKPLAKNAKKDGIDDAGVATLALVGGFPAASVVNDLLSHKDPAVRIRAAQVCEKALMGNGITTMLAKKVKDKDPAVRTEVLKTLGTAANFRYQSAQDTLAFMLDQKKWDMSEKLLAVAGFKTAIQFQIKGFYQDPPLLTALIKALNDSEESVRAAAFDAIKPIQESDYDPTADDSKRRQMMVKWEAWLGELLNGNKTAGR
jgi:HEAT repeat protein